jgi:hypothetical protein
MRDLRFHNKESVDAQILSLKIKEAEVGGASSMHGRDKNVSKISI